VGSTLIFIGGSILATLLTQWVQSNLLPLPHPEWASFAATLLIMGFGTVFSALFISAMSMKRIEGYEQER
jgi:hypothetical protein